MSGFLAALQLADSALPIGRFAHSLGLEALAGEEPVTEADLQELTESLLLESVGPLDAVAVAAAHRARDAAELARLDRAVSVRKAAPGARRASFACGRRLAALALELTDGEPAAGFCEVVLRGDEDGNLCVVEGAVAAALGVDCREAVVLELRSAAAAFLSAAVRLGRLPATRAQVLLLRLGGAIEGAAAEALSLRPDEMRSTLPELEIHVLRHDRAEARVFMT